RIASGVLVIITEQDFSLGVAIASTILLNTGVFPLIAATLGLIRIIIVLEHDENARLRQCLLVSRVLFFAGMGLTVTGGVLEGSDNDSDVLIGVKLVKAGYFFVVVFLLCLLVVQGELTTGWQALKAMALAAPFMVVRITFLFLSVFDSSDLRWSALYGPIAPFLAMGLLMEYSVVCTYLITGLIMSPWKRSRL
ncbi:uncharacterized protein N7477_008570, partial [Penicillium maclennaniae]|uniref:uncharacterized protein n=1 Tax=Penicillium maclennaniae TaxID=1343394 RepID=UPI00253F81D3